MTQKHLKPNLPPIHPLSLDNQTGYMDDDQTENIYLESSNKLSRITLLLRSYQEINRLLKDIFIKS
jgi:hypothetical protein